MAFHFTRRGLLIAGVAAIVSPLARPSDPSCALNAEQEEGPYYINDEHLRRDITEGKPGVPLTLRIALVDSKRCAPLANAALDIWHCDASGVYSGFTANSPDGFGGPPGRGPGGPGGPGGPPPNFGPGGGGPPPMRQTDTKRFLRGVQVTNDQGVVEFATVYPGWYFGRAIHIHLKAHLGGHVAHTGQLFFPEDVTADVAKLEPYAKRLNVHRTKQSEDNIFETEHGSESMVTLTRLKKGSNADGFLATVTLAVDPEATPKPVHGFGGPPPRGPRS
jgi:protocatechuate 3,4-dioxygenase beta subunit